MWVGDAQRYGWGGAHAAGAEPLVDPAQRLGPGGRDGGVERGLERTGSVGGVEIADHPRHDTLGGCGDAAKGDLQDLFDPSAVAERAEERAIAGPVGLGLEALICEASFDKQDRLRGELGGFGQTVER